MKFGFYQALPCVMAVGSYFLGYTVFMNWKRHKGHSKTPQFLDDLYAFCLLNSLILGVKLGPKYIGLGIVTGVL